MATSSDSTPTAEKETTATQTIVIQQPPPSRLRKWVTRIALLLLLISVIANISMYVAYREYFAEDAPPYERYHSGSRTADAKIALLEMTGTIMPPFTGRLIKTIRRARRDETVKGCVLVIDSPGGLVADSHQIYHELKLLSAEKPMVVVMKRMAASGGYYIAMGAGPEATIYAEPTTWTGSIGVIIPRYNARVLAEDKLGVRAEPLKTGRFKDSLSPFRDLRPEEYQLWNALLDDSFDRFLQVVADNRPKLYRRDARLAALNAPAALLLEKKAAHPPTQTVEYYATGQVFTAKQAVGAGLVDKIGFLQDAIDALKEKLGEDKVRIVRYEYPLGLLGMFTGLAKAQQPAAQWEQMRNLAVPQPMYYCSSLPLIPAPQQVEQ